VSAAFNAACVQFTAGPDPAPNLQQVSELIRRARGAGADLIERRIGRLRLVLQQTG